MQSKKYNGVWYFGIYSVLHSKRQQKLILIYKGIRVELQNFYNSSNRISVYSDFPVSIYRKKDRKKTLISNSACSFITGVRQGTCALHTGDALAVSEAFMDCCWRLSMMVWQLFFFFTRRMLFLTRNTTHFSALVTGAKLCWLAPPAAGLVWDNN